MSVFGVVLVRIQSECGKIRARIAPNTDTFHAVARGAFNTLAKKLLRWVLTLKLEWELHKVVLETYFKTMILVKFKDQKRRKYLILWVAWRSFRNRNSSFSKNFADQQNGCLLFCSTLLNSCL